MGIKSIGKALAENANMLAKAIKDMDDAEIDRRLDVCGRLAMAMRVARHGPATAARPAERGTRHRDSLSMLAGREMIANIRTSRPTRPAHAPRLTPRWEYIAPLLGFLDSRGGELVATHIVKNHLDGTVEHTSGDVRTRKGRHGNIVNWRYEVDWTKRVLLVSGLVEDNGSRGRGAQWRITPHGSAMLKLLLANDIDAEKWWRENEPNARNT